MVKDDSSALFLHTTIYTLIFMNNIYIFFEKTWPTYEKTDLNFMVDPSLKVNRIEAHMPEDRSPIGFIISFAIRNSNLYIYIYIYL